ncbi:hypothetical protein ACJX0J_041489, partial [Zea mays]
IRKESLNVGDHIYSWKLASWAWIDYLDKTPAPFGEHIHEPFVCASNQYGWFVSLRPVVDAKVIHLGYNNSCIFLSLKDVK